MKEFITADIWLAAAISILLNHYPNFKVKNGKTLFIFPGDDYTYRAISSFNDGSSINCFQYAQTVKRLKVEMISRRSPSFEQADKITRRPSGGL